MDPAFDLRLAAPLIRRPAADYQACVERAWRAAASHLEAARHLGLFDDRLRGLTVEELDELFRETFKLSDQAALAEAAAAFQRAGLASDAVAALPVLERLLPSLAADRNPFTLLFKALCCLLISRGTQEASPSVPIRHSSSHSE